MKTASLKVAVAAVLACAAAPAFATVPSVPNPFPVAGPTPDADTGNSGLIVSAWDSTRGVSLVTYLGLRMDDFLPGDGNATPEAGLNLDFGVLPEWSTVFTGSNSADIQYEVSAFDFTADSGNTTIGKRLLTTATALGTVRNTSLIGATSSGRSFIAGGLNGASNCNGGNPCVALSNSEGDYAGQATFGSKYNGQLPVSASGAVDTALNFYYVTANNNNSLGNAVNQQFANSTGVATWLLTSSGQLTYNVPSAAVPLPAAIWLLLSGVAGLGAVGRRRSVAQA